MVVTYNAMISACEKGNDLPSALQCCRALQEQSFKPSIITYNSLIHAMAKGLPEHAFQILEKMQRQGVVAVVITDSSLISAMPKI